MMPFLGTFFGARGMTGLVFPVASVYYGCVAQSWMLRIESFSAGYAQVHRTGAWQGRICGERNQRIR